MENNLYLINMTMLRAGYLRYFPWQSGREARVLASTDIKKKMAEMTEMTSGTSLDSENQYLVVI